MKPFLLLALILAALTVRSPADTVMGRDWVLQQPKPTAENLRGIATDGSTSMVAVGDHGTILTASALTGPGAWTVNTSGTTQDLWDVLHFGSQYLAVGSGGTILLASDTLSTTPTGLTWSRETGSAFVDGDTFYSIAASGVTVVAVGVTSTGQGVSVVSPNSGTNWSRAVLTSSTAIRSVTFVGSSIYAVMDNVLLSSSNGLTWGRTSLPSTTVKSIAYANTGGTDAQLVITGSQNWVIPASGKLSLGSAPAKLAVRWSGTQLEGVDRLGDLYVSASGALWQKVSTSTNVPFNAVAMFGTTFVAVGDNSVIQSFASTAGAVWTSQTASGTPLGTNGIAWNQRIDSSALYVAVGWGMSWTSPDGNTWTEHAQTGLSMLSVMWTGTNFVAVGNGLWISTDGITWTSRQTAPSTATVATGAIALPSIYAVAPLNGLPYAFGYNPVGDLVKFAASSDTSGFSWSNFFTISATQWAMLGVAQSNTGLCVAAGWGGRVLTTTTPSTGVWKQTIVPLVAGEDFTDVQWANGQFTAVTSEGGIWTSTNGTVWAKARIWQVDSTGSVWAQSTTGKASHALWCLTRTANEFLAAGDHGLVVTSFNGQDWQERSMGTSQFTNQILSVPATTTKTDTTVMVVTTKTTDTTTSVTTTSVATTTDVATTFTFGSNTPVTPTHTPTTATTSSTAAATSDELANPTPAAVTVGPTTTSATTGTAARLIAAGGLGTFHTSNGTAPVQPVVNLTTTTPTITEASGVGTVNVTLSTAWNLPVTVTLGFAGNAASTTYTRSATTVTFIPGQPTTQSIQIVALEDTIDRHNPSVIVSVAKVTGDAAAGTSATVTINDDEHVPTLTPSSITSNTSSKSLVYLGQPVTFTSTPTGTGPITFQWQHNGVSIAGATQSYYLIPRATYANAGTYTVVARNAAGVNVGAALPLGVVDAASQGVTARTNEAIIITAPVAGSGLTYQWYLNGSILAGETRSTLSLGSVQAVNAGTYTCTVTRTTTDTSTTPATTTTEQLSSGPITLSIVTAAPIAGVEFPVGVVGGAYNYAPVVTSPTVASHWAMSGLPAGLTVNTTTGVVSGTPTRAGSYVVKVSVSNEVVKSGSSFSRSLVISKISSFMTGSFMAIVPQNSTVNFNLGGRLDLAVSTAGTFTGKLTDPSGTWPFSGILSGNDGHQAAGSVLLPTSVVTFNVSDDGTNVAVATKGALQNVQVKRNSVTTDSVNGWRQTASTAAVNRSGYYTMALSPSTGSGGSSYASFTLAVAGTGTMVGRVADSVGSKLTNSFIAGPNGEIGVYVPLYGTLGSLQGQLLISADSASKFANNAITVPSATSLYLGSSATAAIAATTTALTADGGHFAAPAKGKNIMNPTLTTAVSVDLAFSGLDPTADGTPGGQLTVSPPAVVSPTSPQLLFTPTTGEYHGTFSLVGGRLGSYFGTLIRSGGTNVILGKGFYYAPDTASGVITGGANVSVTP